MAGARLGPTDKKPTAVASRGFLSKLCSASTSTISGAGNYYQRKRNNNSTNNTEHQAEIKNLAGFGQAWIPVLDLHGCVAGKSRLIGQAARKSGRLHR